MESIDFVIEVYKFLPDKETSHRYLYRFIPVGTTFTVLAVDPVFCFKGKFHKGVSLPLDSPVKSYTIDALTFIK